MANTTFSGPVTSTNGFIGDVTGNVTGNITGTVTGTVIQPVSAVTAAGTNLATAAATAAGINVVAGADGTKGVKLPAAAAGTTIMIYSSVATNGLVVYANSGNTINGGASVTMEGQTWLQAVATSNSAWLTTIFTANT